MISLLRSVYRRACVDHEGLRNPVDLWLAAGGRFNPIVRRVISSPAEALPYWQRGIEAAVKDPATRSISWVAMYSGMRRGEILTLRWERVDLARGVVHVPHTKTGTPLELPITRQLAAILEWRRSETGGSGWVFPSSSRCSPGGRIYGRPATARRPAPRTGITVRETSGAAGVRQDDSKRPASSGCERTPGVHVAMTRPHGRGRSWCPCLRNVT